VPTTATVDRVVVPQVNHLKPENLVSTTAGNEKPAKHRTYTVAAGQGTAGVVDDLTSSSSSSSDESIERYDKEPVMRRPGSRSSSEDLLDIDLEEYNEEPGSRKQRKDATKHVPEKIDRRLPADKKVAKKGPRLESGGDGRSRGFADRLPNSPGISEDVWKEAMEGVPLASSESFDMHLMPSRKDHLEDDDDDDDDDDNAFERRGRRKGKTARSGNRINDLKWSADLPINDSLSRETLDDISCDSYVPPHPVTSWDVDALETNIDDYTEEGSAKVLDVLARTPEDPAQGPVVGRRKERVDKEQHRKKTPSTSFETNIDDIEFDTEPRENVANVMKEDKKARQPQENAESKEKHKRSKEKGKRNVPDTNRSKETAEVQKEKDKQRKQPTKDRPEPEESAGKEKVRKPRQPTGGTKHRRSATIPIMAAAEAAGTLPYEEDEDSYSEEPRQDLSADINIRLWQGPTTNIDDDVDDDETEDTDQMPSNLHDQRLEEDDSIVPSEPSVDEKPMPVKPPTSSRRPKRRHVDPTSSTSEPADSHTTESPDRLPGRPRKAQPTIDSAPSSKQRMPRPRSVAAQRTYHGIRSDSGYIR